MSIACARLWSARESRLKPLPQCAETLATATYRLYFLGGESNMDGYGYVRMGAAFAEAAAELRQGCR